MNWTARNLRHFSVSPQGFGANLPLLVLPYVVDWVVGPQAATDLVGSPGMLFAACVVVHMVVRLPVTFVWKWAAGRFGKYHTFLAFNIMYGVYMFAFLAVTKGQALLSIILCGLWVLLMADTGSFWTCARMWLSLGSAFSSWHACAIGCPQSRF